jgi:fatty acid desaturase
MAKRIDPSKFPKRTDASSLAIIALHVLIVIAPVYLAAFIGPRLYWLPLGIWFGVLMNGLLNLMHECAHFHVFRARAGSDFLGRWILGPLALADFDAYRSRHWKHHIHLGTDEDTKDAYLIDIARGKIFLLLLRCLLLLEAARKFRHQTNAREPKRDTPASLTWLAARTAVVQILFFLSLVAVAALAAGRPWQNAVWSAVLAYATVYGYGLASITVFAATLRAIAEHQLETGLPSPDGRAALRNFHCGPFSLLVFGAYGFAEHATHHREPRLPYYWLREATRELGAHDPALLPTHEYLPEIFNFVRSRPVAHTQNALPLAGEDS